MAYFKVFMLIVFSILGGLAVIAAVYAIYSLVRNRKTEKYLGLAKQYMHENRKPEAAAAFLKAESTWHLNSHNGSRDSLSRDLDHFIRISQGLFKLTGTHSGTLVTDVNSLVSEMKSVLKNRENFGIDGRKMKPEVATHWIGLGERLQSLRSRLRTECNPRF